MPMVKRSELSSRVALAGCLLMVGCDDPATDAADKQPSFVDDMIAGVEPQATGRPIVLDGQFDDWEDVAFVVDEPSDDAAAGSPIDLGPVRISHDATYVYLLVDWGAVVNAQGLPDCSLELWLDVDGLAGTGLEQGLVGNPVPDFLPFGYDARLVFTPIRGGYARGGIELHRLTGEETQAEANQLRPYDVNLAFAPTYANDRVEIRVRRGEQPDGMPPWLRSTEFRGVLWARDADGTELDRVEEFTYSFDHDSVSQPTAAPLPNPIAGTLRVMNWNVERGAFFRNPNLFAATFRAIEPDVILLQELRDTQTADMVDAWFEEHVSMDDADSDEWSVIVGAGGGDLRCAIASRLPLNAFEPLRLIAFPDNPDRHVRIAAAVIEFEGRDVLLVATHLKCCGSAGSREDETRLLEVALLREALDDAIAHIELGGLVIAGDLNLVGSRDPLDELAAGGDLDGGDLEIADLMQLDRLTNATWHDADQPFVPGRLDWLLFSGTALALQAGFVFDSRDLSPEALVRHGLKRDATITSSDHFPLVADLDWLPDAREPD